MRKKPIKKAFHIGLSLVLMLGMISAPSLGATGTGTGFALKADKFQQKDNNPKPSLSAQLQALKKQTPNTPAAQIIANKTSAVNDLTKAAASQTRKSNWNVTVPDNKKQVKVDPTKATNSKPTSINTTKDTIKSVPNELIVKFKQSTDAKTSRDKYSLQKVKTFPSTGGELLKTPQGVSVDTVINSLKADNSVEYAQPNYKYQKSDIPNDPSFGDMWGLKNTGQNIAGYTGTPGIDINAPGAWDVTKGSNTVIVADIDTGDDISHPDLQGQIWTNPGEIPGNGIDDDHDGFIDDVHGWDFYHGDNTLFDPGDINPGDGSPSDSHGTHTAGTIAATMNNSLGIAGVAPNVKVMPVKFLGPDGGDTANAICAIEYAASKGAKIANMSWGGGGYDQALKDAIQSSKMLFVAAAGNDGQNNDITPAYPASYDCSNILSVAAVDNTGNLAGFSNYGAQTVDVAAPGVDVLSTIPNGGYAFYSGTSMATPHVTGTAALLYSLYPDMTPMEAIEILKNTGTPLSSLQGNVASGRLINAANAVHAKLETMDDDIPGVQLDDAIVKDTVDASSDKDDVHSIWLNKGETLTTSLSGDAGTDFDLYLFAPNAMSVNSSDGMVGHSENVGTSTESIQYTALTAGYYYIDVYAYSGSGAYTLTAGNVAGTYEDTNSALLLNGPWSTLSGSQYSGGTAKQLNSNGDVEFTFIGSQIEWKAFMDDTQGTANVYIDGGLVKAISLYSPVPTPTQTIFLGPLQYCKHTIKIEWTGLRDPAARKTSTNINIDSFVVSDPPDTTPPSVPTLNDIYFDSYNWGPHLSWTAVPDTDVSGYNLYRQEGSSDPVLANPHPIKPQAALSYVDNNTIPGHTYQYSISAVDYSGNESAHSQPKTFVNDDDLPGIPMIGTSASGTLNQDTDKFDVWSVHLDAGQTYAFSFNGDSGTDFDYYLFSPMSTSLNEFYPAPIRHTGGSTSEEYFTYPVTTSGTYYIATQAYNGSGAYNFNVTSKPTAFDDNITGTPLPSGNKVSDFLDYIDTDDVYSVVLKAGDTIHVALGSQAHNSNDFDVYLFPSSATTIKPTNPAYIPNVAGSNTLGTSTESFTYVAPSAGTYFIDVSNAAGSGPYDLSATVTSPDLEAPVITAMNPAEGSTVSSNFTVTGTATDNDVVDHVDLTAVYTSASDLSVKRYSLLPSNNLMATSTTYNFTGTIDLATLGAKEGPISIEAIAYDKAGNKSATVTRNYTFNNSTTTIVEDSDTSISYMGTWSSGFDTGNSGGTLHSSSTAASTAQLTFTGTGIKILAKTASNRGLADVYIDNTLNKTIDLYSPSTTFQSNVFELSGLSNTSHTIKIVVKGSKSSSSSGVTVALDAFVVISSAPITTTGSSSTTTTTTIEDSDISISYTGTWSSGFDTSNSGGTLSSSSTAASTAQLTFTGTGIKILAKTASNRGLADIYIDNTLNKTIDLYSPSTTFQSNVFELSGLSNTSHTIKVVVKGSKSSSSSGVTVALDAFVITSSAPITTTIEDSDTSISYTGTWSSGFDTGNSGGTLHSSSTAASTAQLTFTGTGIKILAKTASNRGLADIYIDNTLNKTIDLYSPSTTFQSNVFELSGLSNTSHTIKVVVKGSKSSSSSGVTVALDAFVVTSLSSASTK